MTGRTHDLAAITALGVVVLAVPTRDVTLSTALLAVLANLMGGIAPDIDEPTAPLWRNLPVGGVLGRIIDKCLGGHRFLTHSLLGVAILGSGFYLLLLFLHPIMPHTDIKLVWDAFIIGMLSHLVMDTLTKEGVPWLLPIPFKFGLPPLRDLRITTGKFIETFVVFPLILVFDVYYCYAHYTQIVSLLHNHIVK